MKLHIIFIYVGKGNKIDTPQHVNERVDVGSQHENERVNAGSLHENEGVDVG